MTHDQTIGMPSETSILDALPLAVYMTDASGWIIYFNDAAAVLWGRRPALGDERWCGSWRIYLPDGRPQPHEQTPLARALRGEVSKFPVGFIERPDGTRTLCRSEATLVRDAAGTVIGAVAAMIDLTSLGAGPAPHLSGRDRRAEPPTPIQPGSDGLARLSARERQVFDGIVGGLSTKAIARGLGISPRTVEIQRRNMMFKLQVRSVAELVRLSLQPRE